MKISLFRKSYKYIGSHLKGAFSPVKKKSYNVGDYLDISSLKKNTTPEDYECKGFTEIIRQIRRYRKAFGVNWWDIFKGNTLHCADVIPSGIFDKAIQSVKRIATVKVKTRSGKFIDANIDKIDMGVFGTEHEYFYVLKRNNKQIGYINTVLRGDNIVDIAFLTNILGRKQYRNTEKILIQAVVEDCLRKGFIPKIDAIAQNVGQFMGRGYNNLALYKKMGMSVPDAKCPDVVAIEEKAIIPLLEKYIKHNGEIFKGTKERLELLK